MDREIVSGEKRKKAFVDGIKKLTTRRRNLKEKIEGHVKARKATDEGLDDSINNILRLYKVLREVYHGGNFNGVNGKRIMSNAHAIMADIEQLLKLRKRDDSELSDEDISKLCGDCATVLTLFDDYFRILRTGTKDDEARATDARRLALAKLREMELSVTPKVHLLERHAVEQMCKFKGGLKHVLEDWVEKFHQTAYLLEDNIKRLSCLEKRADAYGSLQEILGNERVVKRACEVLAQTKRVRTKRGAYVK